VATIAYSDQDNVPPAYIFLYSIVFVSEMLNIICPSCDYSPRRMYNSFLIFKIHTLIFVCKYMTFNKRDNLFYLVRETHLLNFISAELQEDAELNNVTHFLTKFSSINPAVSVRSCKH